MPFLPLPAVRAKTYSLTYRYLRDEPVREPVESWADIGYSDGHTRHSDKEHQPHGRAPAGYRGRYGCRAASGNTTVAEMYLE